MDSSEKAFDEAVDEILCEDTRYKRSAYVFVCQGLNHTCEKIMATRNAASGEKSKRNLDAPTRPNVSGRDLSNGLIEYALDQYGSLAYHLLDHWGMRETMDFGQIVFNLIGKGVFSKTEEDCLEDFRDVFPFAEKLLAPFEPSQATCRRVAAARAASGHPAPRAFPIKPE